MRNSLVRMTMAAAVAASLFATAGCGKEPMSPEALEILRSGITAYNRGDDWTAVQRMDTFVARHGNTRRVDEAYYFRGLAHQRLKDPDKAKLDFTAALDNTDREDLEIRSYLALGDIAYDAGDTSGAEEMYRRVLAEGPRGDPPADHALYRLGATLQRQGNWHEADLNFNELIDQFSDTEMATLSSRRVHATAWTIQVAAFQSKERADTLARKLRESDHPAFVWPASMKDGLYYLVRVGRHQTHTEAAASLRAVQAIAPEAFVTVTR